MPTLPQDFAIQRAGAGTGACNWCWLAVAASVDDYYVQPAKVREQCDMAHLIIPTTGSCCGHATLPKECDKAGDLAVALGRSPGVDRLRRHVPNLAGASDIRTEVFNHRPLGVKITIIDEDDRTVHALAIVNAYLDPRGDTRLELRDPDNPSATISIKHGDTTVGRWDVNWDRTYFTRR